jgi:hypothetical protein
MSPPEAATGLVKRAALAAGRPTTPTGPAGTSAARDATDGPAGPASAIAVAPDANAATATAELASLRVSLEGMRLRTVLKEDKRNLWSGALGALGFRPGTSACRQRRGATAAARVIGAVQGTGPPVAASRARGA